MIGRIAATNVNKTMRNTVNENAFTNLAKFLFSYDELIMFNLCSNCLSKLVKHSFVFSSNGFTFGKYL